MITMNDILGAINDALVSKFPEDTVYVNLQPKDYVRPSFLIALMDVARTEANRSMISVSASFSITCYTEIDGHYNSDVNRLTERQTEVMDLFLCGYLSVGDRNLEVQAAEGGVDFGESYVDLSFDYFDDRPIPGDLYPFMETVKTNMTQEG